MHRHVIKQLMVGAALLDVGLLSCRNARFSIPMNPSTIRNVRFRKKRACVRLSISKSKTAQGEPTFFK